MRIPFPERVPINRVGIFTLVLFAIQRLEGTPFYFSVGCSLFILIAAFAFNTAGGLTRASGVYVFSYSTMAVLIGVCYKAVLGEPAQSNLIVPRTDIEVYVGSIAGMFAAVVVSRRFSRSTGLLQNLLKDPQCTAPPSDVSSSVSSVRSPLRCLARAERSCKPLLRSAESVDPPRNHHRRHVRDPAQRRHSQRQPGSYHRRRLLDFFLEMTGFSRQGMLTPFYCWLLPVAAMRYRLSSWKMISCLLALSSSFIPSSPFRNTGAALSRRTRL